MFDEMQSRFGTRNTVGVSAIGRKHFSKKFEDMAYMTVLFDSTAIAHFHVNWIAPVKVRTTLIGGTKRMVVMTTWNPRKRSKSMTKASNC